MPSVPNMRVAATPSLPGAPATPDAVIADIFARIIAGGPATVTIGEAPAAVPAAPVGEMSVAAPETVEGETLDEEDAPQEVILAPAPELLPLLHQQSGFPVTIVAPVARTEAATSKAVALTPSAPMQPMLTATAAKAGKSVVPAGDGAPRTEVDADPESPVPAKPSGEAVAAKAAEPGVNVKIPIARPTRDDAAPRPMPAVLPLAEQSAPVAPVEAPSAPLTTATSPVTPSATPALPPFFTPAPSAPIVQAAPTPSAPAEIAVERELDLARDGAWLDRLARDIARAGSEDGAMRFRLHPQTLGHMRVELSQSDQGATVRLTVETEAARNILIDAQPRLAAEARAQGVRLAGTEVDLAGSGPQTGDPRRQADAEARPVIRTARGQADAPSADQPGAARSDRYA